MEASSGVQSSGKVSSVPTTNISKGISAHSSNCFLRGDLDARIIFSIGLIYISEIEIEECHGENSCQHHKLHLVAKLVIILACVRSEQFREDQKQWKYNARNRIHNWPPPLKLQHVNLYHDEHDDEHDHPYCDVDLRGVDPPDDGHGFATVFLIAFPILQIFDGLTHQRSDECKSCIEKRKAEELGLTCIRGAKRICQ